ncbi:MAG: GNAT family N-acetyltransferase [Phototrophicaceae bacterium]
MLNTIPQTLVTTYLEITHPNQFKPSFTQADGVRVERMDEVDLGFYRYLYQSVGEEYRWRDRLVMPKSELRAILESSKTHVFVLYVYGAPAGYVELNKQGRSTEIAYFGLRSEYHGRGLGKHLLSYGIQKAWELGSERIWLHTCNLDGAHALSNYRKRGFKPYMEEREEMPSLYQ